MVTDLQAAREARGRDWELLFVHRDSVERGREFFEEHAPDVPWIADSDAVLFDGFEIRKATFRQMFGLRNFAQGWRAWRAGYGVGKPSRDVSRMPGVFLLQAGTVLWSHPFDTVGDHPEFASIGDLPND